MSNIDRFNNMRAQGQGGVIIQEGDGELSQIGYPISIEAATALSIGDRISAVKNNAKTLASNSIGYSFSAISEDMTVAMQNPTFTMNTTGLTIFFLDNTKNYTPVVMDIDNDRVQEMLTTIEKTSITGTAFLNERGDRFIIIFNGSYYLIGTINKKDQTINYRFIDQPLYTNYSEKDYSSNWEIAGWGTSCILVGDYFIYMGNIKGYLDTDSSKTLTRSKTLFYRLSGLNFRYMTCLAYMNYSSKAFYNGNTLLTINSVGDVSYGGPSLTITKYYMSGDNVTVSYSDKFHSISQRYDAIGGLSGNGKYVTVNDHYFSFGDHNVRCTLYDLDRDTLTLTQKCSVGLGYNRYNGLLNARSWPANDGSCFLTRNGIFDENGNKIFNLANTGAVGGYFDPDKWINGSTMYSITTPNKAEYLARKITSSITEADKLYGIATSDLSVGEIGSARALFNTRN